MPEQQKTLEDRARIIRAKALRALHSSKSGHPGASLSSVDIITSLFFNEMNFERGDEFILGKGHAVPALYGALSEMGEIDDKELLTLRQEGSRLLGHPVADTFPQIKFSTGSLGQAVSAGAGMAMGKKLKGSDGRVYVVPGDGELQEGQNWEAFMAAAQHRLDNLVIVVDRNGYQNDGSVNDTMDLGNLVGKFQSFGWNAFEVDGHKMPNLRSVYQVAREKTGRPTAIIANTTKGHGVAHIAGDRKKHNGAMTGAEFNTAMTELGAPEYLVDIPTIPASDLEKKASEIPKPKATRDAFGESLVKAGRDYENIVVVDCDLGSATRANKFGAEFPDRFIQLGIAEQNGVSFAAGLSKEGFRPFISSFAAFLTQRAKDQIMNSVAYSNAGVVLVGTHAGLAIGKDGATQMGIDDINAMSGIPTMEIYSPADEIETRQIVDHLAGRDLQNPVYLRLSRRPQPNVYSESYKFEPGKISVMKTSQRGGEDVTLVATGDMVYHALEASEALHSNHGINARVINVPTLKPFNYQALAEKIITKKVVSLEDHSIIGGLGSRVAETISEYGVNAELKRHGIRDVFGESGDPADLYRKHNLDVTGIVETVRDFLN